MSTSIFEVDFLLTSLYLIFCLVGYYGANTLPLFLIKHSLKVEYLAANALKCKQLRLCCFSEQLLTQIVTSLM